MLCVYSSIKIKANRWKSCSHYVLWSLVLCKHAGNYVTSFITISFPTSKKRHPQKNKYVIYRASAVRMGKNYALGLQHGPRPSASDCTQDLGQLFPIRTSRPVNNIYVCITPCSVLCHAHCGIHVSSSNDIWKLLC